MGGTLGSAREDMKKGNVPGGIQIGQHWLHVQLAGSSLQVPFRIMTDDEEKMLRKRWEELKKELDGLLAEWTTIRDTDVPALNAKARQLAPDLVVLPQEKR